MRILKHKKEQGFVIMFLAIVILIAMVFVGASVSALVLFQIKILSEITNSTQAYFAAEAGVEDMVLRVISGMNTSVTSTLELGGVRATTSLSSSAGGTRTVISRGQARESAKKVRAIVDMNTTGISFFYGAQAGDGGIDMEANSKIHGNVFSNGTIRALTGTAYIDYNAIVANPGNRIENMTIGTAGEGNKAMAYTCVDSIINGDLYYVSGGSSNCIVNGGSTNVLSQDIEPEDLPISDEQVAKWKGLALKGGVEPGDYIIAGRTIEVLGPKKINGNLIIENNAALVMSGTLWVTGDLELNNGVTISLDNNYGPTSGVLIVDGEIFVANRSEFYGSGQEGSYLMLLSTSNSADIDNPAIDVHNTAGGDIIFYASNGMIRLRNRADIREAVGWKIYLDNNVEVSYEAGLANSLFSSGPAGGWELADWSEIE